MPRAFLLAAGFGLAMGGVFAAVWLGLERAWTEKTTLAFAMVAISAGLAGLAAAGLTRRLASWPPLVRFAAALVSLVVGINLFAGLFLFGHILWMTLLPTDSLAHMVLFVVTMAAAALYSFLGMGTPLVLLPGLPVILLFAALLARR